MEKGVKLSIYQNIIQSRLIRGYYVSKLAEVLDLTKKIKYIIATTKMDLHNLVQRGLGNHKPVK